MSGLDDIDMARARAQTAIANARTEGKRKRDRARVEAAYARLFDGPEAKIVLADLVGVSGFFESAVVAGDPYLTHHNAGKRDLMLHIIMRLHQPEAAIAELLERRAADAVAAAAEEA